MIDRFFIVFYTGETAGNGRVIGNMSFTTEGKYISATETSEYILSNKNLCEYVITNIIELSEADYKNWGKK